MGRRGWRRAKWLLVRDGEAALGLMHGKECEHETSCWKASRREHLQKPDMEGVLVSEEC
jgi:hypothetical protein